MERFTNLLLIIAVFIGSVVRGKAIGVSSSPKKIIVVQNAKLGDMVCTTPIFRAIKRHIPDARIVVMGNKINKEILSGNSDVDEYIIFEKRFFKLLNIIRGHNFDFGCVLTPDSYAFSLLFLGGVKAVSLPIIKNGYSPLETKTYKIIRKKGILISHHMSSYAPREYLRLLEPLGIFTEDTTKHLTFSFESDAKAQELFSQYEDKILIGISLSAGNKIKEWPVARFAKVANYIVSKYNVVVVIIGGPNDMRYSEEMRDNLNKNVQYINTTGTLSIDEMKATIAKLNLFISVDTGPIYVAEAFEIPTIDIVGPMDEMEQPPVGRLHKVVASSRKTPQIHIMNARLYDNKEARRQVESITSTKVITEVDSLLQELKIVVG